MGEEKREIKEAKESKSPKSNDLSPEEFEDRLFSILDHIENVRNAGRILIKRLIDEDELDLALRLAQRIATHDASKFSFIEWTGMYSSDEKIKKLAIEHHRRTNPHHIQYHTDIKDLTDTDIMEFVCDVKARSEEFGSAVKDYLKTFIEQRDISPYSNFYKRVTYFLNLILEPPFKKI